MYMKRTTLTLDDDVYEKLQAIARSTGEPLGKTVSRLLRQSFPKPKLIKDKDGLPVMQMPPGTPPMNPELIQRFLEEEGV